MVGGTMNKAVRGLLTFSTRSYPTFGRQRKPFDNELPPKSVSESPYYWWYMFLRLNLDYEKTCKSNGTGSYKELYEDFGDVYKKSFKEWWSDTVVLFAEDRPKYRMMIANRVEDIAPFGSNEVLNLVVPLNRSRRSLQKAFSFLVLDKIEKGKKGVNTEESTAKYKLSGKWNIEALSNAYNIYKIKKQCEVSGDKKAWADIAIEAKIPMSYAVKSKVKSENSDIRKVLTILAKRHYDRAEEFIAASTSGTFPYVR
jgi:hypothetical protein